MRRHAWRGLAAGALWLALALSWAPPAARASTAAEAAMSPVDGEVPVRARLVFDATALPRDGAGRVAVALTMGAGWHVYGPLPGSVGAPTRIQLTSGDAAIEPLAFPPTRAFAQFDGAQAQGFDGTLWTQAPFRASDSVGRAVVVSADINLLACKVQCVPGRLALRAEVPVAAARSDATGSLWQQFERGPVLSDAAELARPADARAGGPAAVAARPAAPPAPRDAGSWLSVLLLALLGGAILNAMPCVLPVLVMKAAGLAGAHENSAARRAHAAGYALGTVASMLLLAGMVLVLRALGQAAGWGFQMQQPAFLAAVAVALALFCLHAFDVFTVSAPVSAVAARHADARAGFAKSALEGVLAVLVATPCSAPFLGSATAFALSQTPAMALGSFAAIGVGLAAPFCALALWPGTRRLLPRPGPWMAAVKQALAFSLFATTLWLVGLYAAVAGTGALFALLALLWAAAVGAAVLGALGRVWPQHGGKRLALLLALLLLLGDFLELGASAPAPPAAAAAATGEVADNAWRPWRAADVAATVAAGQPALVEFTAAWCVTCQVNERLFERPAVRAALQAHRVALFRADWTRPDAAILAELERNGRAGVPMTLIFSPRSPTAPERLPELLREGTLQEALGRLP